jgi:hypothetical protein
MAHVEEPPPEVRSLRPEIPAAVSAVVTRLLAKKPEERFATPRELAEHLERLLAELNSPAAKAAKVEPVRRSASFPWWVAVPLGVAAVVLVIVASRQFLTKTGRSDLPETVSSIQTAARPATPRARIVVRQLDLEHYAKEQMGDRPQGLLGEKSFTTHLGDAVTIQGQLSEPAYCYLIAYRPNGTEELCFPEQEHEPPPLTDRPRYPSINARMSYGLDEGTGLEVFLVVASRKPLPAYADWKKSRGTAPWRTGEALAGLVWRYDGEELAALTAEHPTAQRGKDREIQGGGALVRLADWWRQAPEIEAVMGIGLPVLGR